MPVFLLTVVLALTWLAVSVVLSAPCDLQSNGACKCTVAFCDTVEDIGPVGENDIIVYTSSKNGGARLNRTVASFTTSTSTKAAAEPSFKLVLDTAITAQSFFGVGGAFTDAAAVNFVALPDELQKHVLQAYYGPGGIGYSVGRIPIASTDFSTSMYSYDDQANDYNMTSFSIAMDFPSGKIPLIQQAASLAREEGKPLRLFGSSWSPPAWMKTTNSRIGGQMKGVAGDLYHKSYAKYLSLFVTEYGRQANLDLWGITVQNEPNTPELYTWDSCTFTAEEMRDFVKLDLGPRLRADHPQLQLMVLDGQRTYLPTYAETIMADEEAAQFVDGIGMHWYGSVNDLFNVAPKLNATFTEFPQLFGLATEACNGYGRAASGP